MKHLPFVSLLIAAATILGCTDRRPPVVSENKAKKRVPLRPAQILIANDPKGNGRYVISQSVCNGQPRWKPGEDALPISIKELVNIAIDSKLSAELPSREHWRAKNIQFQRFPAQWSSSRGESYPEDRKDRWSIKMHLSYNPDFNNRREWWNEYCYVYMLLDGTLVDFLPDS